MSFFKLSDHSLTLPCSAFALQSIARMILIEELLNRTRLEKLLRDSYGNYCVQVCRMV